MAVIIQDMDMPVHCCQCLFHFRTDNSHTACSRKPMESPIEDGDERPKYCPLMQVVKVPDVTVLSGATSVGNKKD